MSYKEMEDIMKIIKSLEEAGSLIKAAVETIKNEGKGKNMGFFLCH